MPVPNGSWHTNASAIRGVIGGKAALDPRFSGFFYTGPTVHFGHMPPKKGNRR